MKYILLSICLLTAGCVTSQNYPVEVTSVAPLKNATVISQQAKDIARNRTLQLRVNYIPKCRAFLYDRDYVISTLHCVDDPKDKTFHVSGGVFGTRLMSLDKVWVSDRSDLVIFKLRDRHTISYTKLRVAKRGLRVFLFSGAKYRAGRIIDTSWGYWEKHNFHDSHTLELKIQPGLSGSPVFDYDGKFVGISSHYSVKNPSFSGVQSLSEILRGIDILRKQKQP